MARRDFKRCRKSDGTCVSDPCDFRCAVKRISFEAQKSEQRFEFTCLEDSFAWSSTLYITFGAYWEIFLEILPGFGECLDEFEKKCVCRCLVLNFIFIVPSSAGYPEVPTTYANKNACDKLSKPLLGTPHIPLECQVEYHESSEQTRNWVS